MPDSTPEQDPSFLSLDVADCELREEAFFDAIEKHGRKLYSLCKDVTGEDQCNAQSAAVFFATEDLPKSFMVMRGASGRLRTTFERGKGEWETQRKREDGPDRVEGFAYPSKLDEEFLKLTAEKQEQVIRQWTVTNQIWHLATGRIAHTNRAMDQLKQGFRRAAGNPRTGAGDDFAYPGNNLATTFRNMVAVPIFAEGGGTRVLNVHDFEEPAFEYPRSASARRDFLSRYRVIGILKVEDKLPAKVERIAPEALLKRLHELINEPPAIEGFGELKGDEWAEIKRWCEDLGKLKEARDAASEDGPPFPKFMREQKETRYRALRKLVADAFTESCGATFTRQDTELLLLQAMRVGRLMTHRTLKCAASHDIILGENEVGILNIHWHDARQLAMLIQAAEIAEAKIRSHLEQLKRDLDFEKRQEVYRTRISELLDPHGPIRGFTTRRKKSPSLIHKLIRKQRRLEENARAYEVRFPGLKAEFEGYGHLSSESFLGHGLARVYVPQRDAESGTASVSADLGMRGAPHLRFVEKSATTAVDRLNRTYDWSQPLVRRILDPAFYDIDDLCGARIITDYDSDIDQLLDELRRQCPRWGFRLSKVDDLRDASKEGYRAAHVTLRFDLDGHVPKNIAKELKRCLDASRLEMPVEIQLLTAYQDSWARKTHAQTYKREADISDELKDQWHILSDVLGDADWLSDIVKSGIEEQLLPPDFGERKLLRYLRPRLSRDDWTVVSFGIECSKELLKDSVRYNGLPEFSFAMEVCKRLVYRFQVLDSNMLLLSLLRHAWCKASGEPNTLKTTTPESPSDTIVTLLAQELRRHCHPVLQQFRDRLPLEDDKSKQFDWLESWLKDLPPWFCVMQWSARSYFTQRREDGTAQWRERLRDVYRRLKQSYEEGRGKELDDSLERAYIVEAAVLLASLAELTSERGRKRQIRLLNEYRILFREIQNFLPNRPIKARVVEELSRALRSVEV